MTIAPPDLLTEVDPTLRSLARRWAARFGLDFDDLLQDARALVVAHAANFDPALNTPKRWAKRLALGALRDGSRRRRLDVELRRKRRQESAGPSVAGIEDVVIGRELADEVNVALAALPADQATLVRKFFGFNGLPVASVRALAHEIGCHPSVVSRRLQLACATLRTAIRSVSL